MWRYHNKWCFAHYYSSEATFSRFFQNQNRSRQYIWTKTHVSGGEFCSHTAHQSKKWPISAAIQFYVKLLHLELLKDSACILTPIRSPSIQCSLPPVIDPICGILIFSCSLSLPLSFIDMWLQMNHTCEKALEDFVMAVPMQLTEFRGMADGFTSHYQKDEFHYSSWRIYTTLNMTALSFLYMWHWEELYILYKCRHNDNEQVVLLC